MPVNAFDDGKNKVDVYTTNEVDLFDTAMANRKQERHISTTATLVSSDWAFDSVEEIWAQEITINELPSDATVIVSPTPASNEDYVYYGILCISQSYSKLKFKCKLTPANDIDVNIAIFEV